MGNALHFIPDGIFPTNTGHYFSRTYAGRIGFESKELVFGHKKAKFYISYTPYIQAANPYHEPFYIENESKNEFSLASRFKWHYISASMGYSFLYDHGVWLHAPQFSTQITFSPITLRLAAGCFLGAEKDCRYSFASEYLLSESIGINMAIQKRDWQCNKQYLNQNSYSVGIGYKIESNLSIGINLLQHSSNSEWGYQGNAAIIGLSVNF